MANTMLLMAAKKAVQIRVAVDLAADVALVAAAFNQTPVEWVDEILRAAVARDMPKVARIAKDRADSATTTKNKSG